MTEWQGFKCEEFKFEGRDAIIVFPNEKSDKWLFKTEYFGAFPDFEIEMVKRGYHIVHVNNLTRWNKHPDDTDIKAKFADYVSEKYGLKKKCVTVGMSCGGMQSIYFAAKYPQLKAERDAVVAVRVNIYGQDDEFMIHDKEDIYALLDAMIYDRASLGEAEDYGQHQGYIQLIGSDEKSEWYDYDLTEKMPKTYEVLENIKKTLDKE